jgi:hypothetical protein
MQGRCHLSTRKQKGCDGKHPPTHDREVHKLAAKTLVEGCNEGSRRTRGGASGRRNLAATLVSRRFLTGKTLNEADAHSRGAPQKRIPETHNIPPLHRRCLRKMNSRRPASGLHGNWHQRYRHVRHVDVHVCLPMHHRPSASQQVYLLQQMLKAAVIAVKL